MTRSRQPSLRFHLASFGVLAVVCGGLYANVLDAEFVLDDFDNILKNPYDRWTELDLESLRGAVFGPAVRRPVAHLSFGLNHYFGGYDPRGYRAVNVAIHLANALLVYALAWTLLGRLRGLPGQADPAPDRRAIGWMALFAALLFAAHPLQIQSVTYVVQRMNSLAAGFYLAALLLVLRGRLVARASIRRLCFGAAAASGLLALGSKEIAVTLPFAIGLAEWYFIEDLDRGWLRRRLPIAGALVVGGLVLLVLYAQSPDYAGRGFSAGERLLTQLRVAIFYISLVGLPLPSRLNLLHEIDPSRSLLAPPSTLLCAGLLVTLLAIAVRVAQRRRLLSFAILWFLLHLALEGSTLPLRMIFEHRTYLPLVGVAIFVSYALFAALRERRRTAIAVATLAVAALGSATWVRNAIWSDAPRLWTDVAAKSPGDSLARMQLASVQAREGRYEAALASLEASIRLDPSSPRPHNLKGAVLLAVQRPEEALAAHLEASRLDARDHTARANAASILASQGRLDEAALLYEDALRILPEEAYVLGLGRVRELQGRTEPALALYRRAAAMNPRQREARVAAAVLLARSGRPEAAVVEFELALAAAPPDSELHTQLGKALWAAGRPREAIAQLEAAVALRPEGQLAVNILAWMLASGPDAALRDPDRAIALAAGGLRGADPPDPKLADALAAGYAASGRFPEAVAAAERASRLARAAGEDALADEIDARRALYESRRSYVLPRIPSP